MKHSWNYRIIDVDRAAAALTSRTKSPRRELALLIVVHLQQRMKNGFTEHKIGTKWIVEEFEGILIQEKPVTASLAHDAKIVLRKLGIMAVSKKAREGQEVATWTVNDEWCMDYSLHARTVRQLGWAWAEETGSWEFFFDCRNLVRSQYKRTTYARMIEAAKTIEAQSNLS